MTYVALLRGINIGPRNRIGMSDLKVGFEGLGFSQVTTYVQSGNVVFSTEKSDTAQLAATISEMITNQFGHTVPVVVLTSNELQNIINNNPFLHHDLTKLHVTFLAENPTAQTVASISLDPGRGDEWKINGFAIYLHCPINYGETKLTNSFFEKKLGCTATTRNWKTVLALQELLKTS
jgi:uncharacterized protein (DUF1697 family)